MGIELYFSNKLEILASKLSELVFQEFAKQNSLIHRPLILVPNQNLARWVQIEMARLHGVSMNLDFRFLEQGLFDLMRVQTANEDFHFLDKELMQLAILRIFQSKHVQKLPLFNRYLTGGIEEGRSPVDKAQRLMDLSGSLAQLLEAYEFHRFELVESWWENSASILEKKEIDADSIEEQSAFLYLCAQANLEALPACGLFQLSRQLPYESGQTQSKTPVYLIGFSQVSRFHIRLLDQLRDYNDFHFLQT